MKPRRSDNCECSRLGCEFRSRDQRLSRILVDVTARLRRGRRCAHFLRSGADKQARSATARFIARSLSCGGPRRAGLHKRKEMGS